MGSPVSPDNFSSAFCNDFEIGTSIRSHQGLQLFSTYPDTLFASKISEHLRNYRIHPRFLYR
jgi:hypothetical protein